MGNRWWSWSPLVVCFGPGVSAPEIGVVWNGGSHDLQSSQTTLSGAIFFACSGADSNIAARSVLWGVLSCVCQNCLFVLTFGERSPVFYPRLKCSMRNSNMPKITKTIIWTLLPILTPEHWAQSCTATLPTSSTFSLFSPQPSCKQKGMTEPV